MKCLMMRTLIIAGLSLLTFRLIYKSALAQNSANFGVITLSSPSQGISQLSGYTQGSVALSSISLEDNEGDLCLGFAESDPDHVIRVEQDFEVITFQVNSGGGDTTLLIKHADGQIWCSDDEELSTDAQIQIANLAVGNYSIWVGSFDPGIRYQYTLDIY